MMSEEDDAKCTLTYLENRRAGLKGVITRYLNDIDRLAHSIANTSEQPNFDEIDIKFKAIDDTAAKLELTNSKLMNFISDEEDINVIENYTQDILKDITNAKYFVHMLKAENMESVHPEDSISQAPSNHSSGSVSLSDARIQAVKTAAKLSSLTASLPEMHSLELEEFQLKQRKQAIELRTQLQTAQAEQEAYNAMETESLISRRSGSVKNSAAVSPADTKPSQASRVDHWTLNPSAKPWVGQVPMTTHVQAPLVPDAMHQVNPAPSAMMNQVNPAPSAMMNQVNPALSAAMNQVNPVSTAAMNQVSSSESSLPQVQNIAQCIAQQQQMLLSLQVPKVELMYFDGDPLRYFLFVKQFETNVNVCHATDCQKLLLLQQYCTGKAKCLIECCLAMEPSMGYARARSLLKERFGNEFVIAEHWISKLCDGLVLKSQDKSGIQDLADLLRNCVENMSAMNMLHEINTQRVLSQIVQRLPSYLRNRWVHQVQKIRKNMMCNPSITDLVLFVEDAALECNDPVFGNLNQNLTKTNARCSEGTHVKSNVHKGKGSNFNVQTNLTKPKYPCAMCQSINHNLFGCIKFKELPVDKRRQLAADKKLCFNCLRSGHGARDCRLERTCSVEGCGKKHTKFLHPVIKEEKEKEPTTKPEKVSATCHATNEKIALPIVQVKVKSQSSPTPIIVNALLDNGSTTSFCTEHLATTLGLKGKPQSLSLTTLDKESNQIQTTAVDLQISSMDEDEFVPLENVYTRQDIPIREGNYGDKSEVSRWEHLCHLNIPDLTTSTVMILIGQDNPDLILPREIRSGPAGSPYATKTRLGWTLNGPLGIRNSSSKIKATTNFIQANEELDEQVARFWKVEDWESLNDDKLAMSIDDHKVIDIWERTIQHEDSNHYTMDIPLKCNLPDTTASRDLAEKRLQSLKRRFQRDSKLYQQYKESMQQLFDKGYAEPVNEASLEGQISPCYLPHQPVFNAKKPGKMRIVFDCAAQVNGVSRNDCVYQGPDLANSLVGVLLRFRQMPTAVMADIEAMFQQVHVTPEQRDVLRFLWWPGGDITSDPVVYRMTTHLFGGTWSPSSCNFALRKTADENRAKYGDIAANKVYDNFYVDDCLMSFEDEESAIKITSDLTNLLQSGGFRLTKFVSNSRNVLASIPEEDRAKEVKGLDLSNDMLPVERALGVHWDVEEDCFQFDINTPNKPLTRRGLLSAVTSIYDPLGFLSPFTLKAKKIIQDLTHQKIGWDEPLADDILQRWTDWVDELPCISDIKIPRAFKTQTSDDILEYELHHFSDASETAYGVVSYLHTVDKSNNVKCHLVMSKSKLAPLRKMTIPRLELTAAALAVKMDIMLKKELGLEIKKSHFWSDSTIVLGYINNTSKRFQTYVANRVSTIHGGSSVNQWRHIESRLNPADEVSRGLSAKELVKSDRWLSGPKFLTEEEQWPKQEEVQTLSDDDPEVKREKTSKNFLSANENEIPPTTRLLEKYSSWYKVQRIVAYMLRLKEFLKKKSKQQDIPEQNAVISVDEMKQAELAIIAYVQRQTLQNEIYAALKTDKSKNRDTSLLKLKPFVSADGILRVGGRLNNANFHEDQLHPAILPKEHHIVDLIIRWFHETSQHSGREHILSLTRQRYWIISGRQAVRHILNNCFKCKRQNAKCSTQLMADHPESRLQVDKAPFSCVGVDMFGPILIKRGRSELKRYGCLFTCLTMRAVHLEVTQSLETDSFINALQRFISRRGRPQEIWCDNGTNFIGAERQLTKSLQEWNQAQVHDFLMQREIKWHFNIPRASHMGGIWERLIRSVKKILTPLLQEQRLDDEGLATLLCQIEATLNARPLTTIPDDSQDLAALTPAHLLLPKAQMQSSTGIYCKEDVYLRKKWRQVQHLTDTFWRRWTREYMPTLQVRQKWNDKSRNFQVGDIVLVAEETPRNVWPLARVLEVNRSDDGLVRSLKLKTSSTILTRPITKLCLLEAAN